MLKIMKEDFYQLQQVGTNSHQGHSCISCEDVHLSQIMKYAFSLFTTVIFDLEVILKIHYILDYTVKI